VRFENSQLIVPPIPRARPGMGGESITQSRSVQNAVIELGEVVMILDLHRQGVSRSRSQHRSQVHRPRAGATGLWPPQATQAFDRSIRPWGTFVRWIATAAPRRDCPERWRSERARPTASLRCRTFAWLGRNRRLAKDFEATIASAEAWVMIASVQLLSRRPARA